MAFAQWRDIYCWLARPAQSSHLFQPSVTRKLTRGTLQLAPEPRQQVTARLNANRVAVELTALKPCTDVSFIEKFRDVVGLYLSPREYVKLMGLPSRLSDRGQFSSGVQCAVSQVPFASPRVFEWPITETRDAVKHVRVALVSPGGRLADERTNMPMPSRRWLQWDSRTYRLPQKIRLDSACPRPENLTVRHLTTS